jgi:glycosyltransferase involved in cell wall biosynthesis
MFCGGQGIYASYLAREWKRAGHDVHVFAGPPLPELEEGIPLHEIPNDNVFGRTMEEAFDPTRPFSLLKPLSLWELGVSRFGVFPEMQTFGFRLMRRWPEIQKRYGFDVVFDNQCLSWGLLGIQKMGVPVVSVIHHPLHIDREADFTIDPSLRKRIERTLYFPLMMQQTVAPRLAKIVTVSEASRGAIEKYFGIPQKAVSVVYNGTDTEIFHPIDKPKESDLLFVGRTEDRKKGIGTMFEALSMLPEHVTLKIVDGRIPGHGLVPRLTRQYGLQGRVQVVDRMLTVPELVEQYATARVALVPSFFEGFGFPASEAMACGLSVIANAAGALPEVVGTDGHAGRLVPQRDARAMADAMWAILRDPAETERMGRAARARVEKLFQWDQAAAQLVEVFEQVIHASRGGARREGSHAAHGRSRAA